MAERQRVSDRMCKQNEVTRLLSGWNLTQDADGNSVKLTHEPPVDVTLERLVLQLQFQFVSNTPTRLLLASRSAKAIIVPSQH